jgi:hypothetical protein
VASHAELTPAPSLRTASQRGNSGERAAHPAHRKEPAADAARNKAKNTATPVTKQRRSGENPQANPRRAHDWEPAAVNKTTP